VKWEEFTLKMTTMDLGATYFLKVTYNNPKLIGEFRFFKSNTAVAVQAERKGKK